jgi:hypothetical protein
MGILPWDKLQAEVGYDVLLPSADPVYFFLNGKVCTPESSLFSGDTTGRGHPARQNQVAAHCRMTGDGQLEVEEALCRSSAGSFVKRG